jgi:hypothetical protein
MKLFGGIFFVEGFRKIPEETSIFRFLALGKGLTKKQLVEESFKQHDRMMTSLT